MSQKMIAIKFSIRPASVYYYQKRFSPTVRRLYSAPEPDRKQKPKSYKDHVKDYYKRIGKPYVTPPILTRGGRYLSWL